MPLIFAILFCMMFAFAGCVTDNSQLSAGGKVNSREAEQTVYHVSTQASIEMASYFKYWPELSGYYLPAGIYKAETEDANGVFFKAPYGIKLLSLTGSTEVEGGIYLPKLGTLGVRGHVYLREPLMGGWESYFLPDEFFLHFGNTWSIILSNAQPNTALEPTATAP